MWVLRVSLRLMKDVLRRILQMERAELLHRFGAGVRRFFAHQRRAAETLKASWHELDTGHYPMLTEPEQLARLIMQA